MSEDRIPAEPRRPRGREHEPAPEEQQRPQEELNRETRDTGGDAPAAGSIEEREAVARDDDELFEEHPTDTTAEDPTDRPVGR